MVRQLLQILFVNQIVCLRRLPHRLTVQRAHLKHKKPEVPHLELNGCCDSVTLLMLTLRHLRWETCAAGHLVSR